METPDTILTECRRNLSGCLDALQAADELERLGLREQASVYRNRAQRQAEKVRRLLDGMRVAEPLRPPRSSKEREIGAYHAAV